MYCITFLFYQSVSSFRSYLNISLFYLPPRCLKLSNISVYQFLGFRHVFFCLLSLECKCMGTGVSVYLIHCWDTSTQQSIHKHY